MEIPLSDRDRQDNVREILAAMRKIPRGVVDHPVLVRAAGLFGDLPKESVGLRRIAIKEEVKSNE